MARYYLTEKKRNLPVSTEITGYAVSSLVYLHSLTGDAATLESAVLSARFLTRSAWVAPISIFPFELDQPFAYFFDCGIIVRGLLAIYRATRNQEYLNVAAACGRAMARDFVAPDGCIHAVLNLPSKQPLAPEPRWSRSPGCYQLKAALAWHELFEETGDPDFEAHYASAVEHALATHESFLPAADREGVMDRLHAYSYFLEGLLPRLEDPRCAEALRIGLDRADALLLGTAPVFERSDVRAQLLRVRLFGHGLGALPLDSSAASAEAALISDYQREDSDRAIHGGFFFGKKGQILLPYVNPVSTGFCAQALAMWREHQGGGVKTCRRMLV